MKVTAITGANSGIGFAAARELAKTDHTIIMICRNQEKAEKAKSKIIKYSGNENIHVYIADLADFDSISSASTQISSDFDQIDNLINNAGLILMSKELTSIGLEKTLVVNHLGHFLLTDLLLPLLMKSSHARIINTSSGAHQAGSFDFSDLNYEKSGYPGFGAYGRSKLANILFTKKLDKLLSDKEISVFSIHPGFVGSNFAKNNGILAKVAMTLLSPFNKSITTGAQPLIYLATEEGVEDKSGEYFLDTSWIPFSKPKIETKSTISVSYDEDVQEKLWEISKNYVKKWNQEYEFNFDNLQK